MDEDKKFLTDEELEVKTNKLKEDVKTIVSEALAPLEEKVDGITLIQASQKEEDKFLKGGFADIGDFAKSVHASRNGYDEKMKSWLGVAEKTLNESVGADGGLTVPPQFSNQLWERSIETSKFYGKAFDIPTIGNEYRMNAVVDESHASNLYGGITMYYKAEEAQYTASYPKFREIVWKLNKLTGLAYISDELLEDSNQNIASVVSRLFSNAMAWQIDKDMLTGTGAGKPQGVLYTPSLISADADTGQAATTLTYTNLCNMWVRQHNTERAEWVSNRNVLPQLMTMTIEGGTASTPVWIPSNDASKRPNGSIFGAPIVTSEHCATLGTAGDIYLIDWSQYGVAHKNNGIKTATSMHLKFDYDQLAFKISFRWDGQSTWNSAFTPANGSTSSPFVNLAARA